MVVEDENAFFTVPSEAKALLKIPELIFWLLPSALPMAFIKGNQNCNLNGCLK